MAHGRSSYKKVTLFSFGERKKRERREEVRAKGTDNSALIYSISICKIHIYHYISNEGNVIHRRKVPKPSLLLASFLVSERILCCVFFTLLQHALWLLIGVVIFFTAFGCF
jgi:hypothetical protein